MFNSLLSPVLNAIYPCAIESIRNSVQKEKRIIDTLEPLMNQHRLVFDYSAIKRDIDHGLNQPKNIYYSLVYQLTHITSDRGSLTHDDRLDVVTLGIQWWNDYGILKQNSEEALVLYKKKQIEDELKRRATIFRNHQMGNKKPVSHAMSRFPSYNR